MININGQHLEITNDLNQKYEITLQSLCGVKGLEAWLCHLNEKTWFTKNHQEMLINFCQKHFGYVFNGKTHY